MPDTSWWWQRRSLCARLVRVMGRVQVHTSCLSITCSDVVSVHSDYGCWVICEDSGTPEVVLAQVFAKPGQLSAEASVQDQGSLLFGLEIGCERVCRHTALTERCKAHQRRLVSWAACVWSDPCTVRHRRSDPDRPSETAGTKACTAPTPNHCMRLRAAVGACPARPSLAHLHCGGPQLTSS